MARRHRPAGAAWDRRGCRARCSSQCRALDDPRALRAAAASQRAPGRSWRRRPRPRTTRSSARPERLGARGVPRRRGRRARRAIAAPRARSALDARRARHRRQPVRRRRGRAAATLEFRRARAAPTTSSSAGCRSARRSRRSRSTRSIARRALATDPVRPRARHVVHPARQRGSARCVRWRRATAPAGLRLTVDTPEDLEFVRHVYAELGATGRLRAAGGRHRAADALLVRRMAQKRVQAGGVDARITVACSRWPAWCSARVVVVGRTPRWAATSRLFLQPEAIVVVFGGTLAALLVSFPGATLASGRGGRLDLLHAPRRCRSRRWCRRSSAYARKAKKHGTGGRRARHRRHGRRVSRRAPCPCRSSGCPRRSSARRSRSTPACSPSAKRSAPRCSKRPPVTRRRSASSAPCWA